MKYIFSLICLVFALNANAQFVDIPWQGYVNTGASDVRVSFYLAGPNLDLTTAFNDRNYPYWYSENNTLQVEGGVTHTVLKDVPVDSIYAYYRSTMWLYVTVNGQPFDKVKISYVPYAVFSQRAYASQESEFAVRANHSNTADTARYAYVAKRSDSSTVSSLAIDALNSLYALSADSADHSTTSDSSTHSTFSVRSSLSDNSQFAILADSAKRARFAWLSDYAENSNNSTSALQAQIATLAIMADSLRDNKVNTRTIIDGTIQRVDLGNGIVNESALANNSVTSAKILDNTILVQDVNIGGTPTNNSVLGYDNGNFSWVSSTTLTGAVQKTTVIPTQINADTRWLILQIAQDFNLTNLNATEGRVITVTNSSTANFVTLAPGQWNIYGGALQIGPRSSRTLVYLNNEWVIIQ
jgi:hypothetical protein